MVDVMLIKNAIAKLEQEKALHDQKFAGNAVHADCLPRFDQAIAKLRAELPTVEVAETEEAVIAEPDQVST